MRLLGAFGIVIGAIPLVVSAAAMAEDATSGKHTPARPDHVLIVIEENRDAAQIARNSDAPYLNSLISSGLYYSNAHAVDHDSQPNYLELLCGTNPGPPGLNSPLKMFYPDQVPEGRDVERREDRSDDPVKGAPLDIPNLGAELIAKGFSFAGYSESMPAAGYLGYEFAALPAQIYARKHNPWSNWQARHDNDIGPNQLRSTTNLPLGAFPRDLASLPNVAFVVPNLADDMHDPVSLAGKHAVDHTHRDTAGQTVDGHTTIRHGDAWLKEYIDTYRRWAMTHNSLLIMTWDENDDDKGRGNDIPIIVVGDPKLVQPGESRTYINHFTVLRMLEDMYSLPRAGFSAAIDPVQCDDAGRLIPTPDDRAR